MVDLASLLLLMSFFKVGTSITYVIVGLIIAVIGGTIIEKLGMEKYIEDFVWGTQNVDIKSEEMTRKDRIDFSIDQVKDIVKYGVMTAPALVIDDKVVAASWVRNHREKV